MILTSRLKNNKILKIKLTTLKKFQKKKFQKITICSYIRR